MEEFLSSSILHEKDYHQFFYEYLITRHLIPTTLF